MKDKKIILGFVGEMVSGKGTICDYLKDNYDIGYHRFSTILRDVLNRLHLENNRANMQEISTLLRGKFGQDLLAKVIAEDVGGDSHNIVVVDGIRRFADIEYLKKIKGFKLIYITADLDARYNRLLKRTENTDDKTKTFDQFKKDHKQESESEVVSVGKTADITINNNGGFKELYQQVDKILN